MSLSVQSPPRYPTKKRRGTTCVSLLLLVSCCLTCSVEAYAGTKPVHSRSLAQRKRKLVRYSVSSKESVGLVDGTKQIVLEEDPVGNKFQFHDDRTQSDATVSTLPANVLEKAPTTEVEGGPGGEVLLWRGVVVILCALWASNFPTTKLILNEPGVDTMLIAVSRFGISALALLPFAINSVRRSGIDGETVRGALVCGSWVAFGYLGQLLGLLTTTASRSCVICTLHCVFVAFVVEMSRVSKSIPGSTQFDVKSLGSAALAVIGVAIVELQGAGGAPTIGDALSFAQPIGFGMGYVQLEQLMRRNPDAGLPVSAIKLTVAAVASLFAFELQPLIDHGALALQLPDFGAILASPIALGGVLYTGLITTALALWVESIAFAKVPATDASIILTLEPLFAAALGSWYLGETFGVSDYFGASLIIGACVLAVLSEKSHVKECIVDEDPLCDEPRKRPTLGL